MSSYKSATALRTIGEVAEELDVATHVLRFWESKFHQIKPQKRRGRRYYRPEDAKIISQIKFLLYDKGYTIRGVQKYLAAEAKNKRSNVKDDISDSKVTKEHTASVENVANSKPLSVNNQNINGFKTDMFGNAIPSNSSVSPLIANKIVQHPAKNKYSEEDIAKLRRIYSGLLDARDRLKKIA